MITRMSDLYQRTIKRDTVPLHPRSWAKRGTPIPLAGAPLYAGRSDRGCDRMAGQSGPAVAGALGAGRSRRTANPSPRPDRVLTRHSRAAPRADKATSRLLTPLIHVKGYAAPETKAAAERARLLIEEAEALGEDPLLLFSVLYSFWVGRFVAFNGKVMRELAAHFLTLAEKEGAAVPLMVGPPWWWRSEVSGRMAVTLFAAVAATYLARLPILYLPRSRLSAASWSWPSHIMKFGPVRIERITKSTLQLTNCGRENLQHDTFHSRLRAAMSGACRQLAGE
jgi:hypothetical protein